MKNNNKHLSSDKEKAPFEEVYHAHDQELKSKLVTWGLSQSDQKLYLDSFHRDMGAMRAELASNPLHGLSQFKRHCEEEINNIKERLIINHKLDPQSARFREMIAILIEAFTPSINKLLPWHYHPYSFFPFKIAHPVQLLKAIKANIPDRYSPSDPSHVALCAEHKKQLYSILEQIKHIGDGLVTDQYDNAKNQYAINTFLASIDKASKIWTTAAEQASLHLEQSPPHLNKLR
jgi:hypothetical protein